MSFQTAPQCVESAFHLSSGTDPFTMVFHFDAHHTVVDADLDAVADILFAWWDSYLYALMPTSVAPVSITTTDISVDGGHQLVSTGFAHATGNNMAGACPINVAIIATWRTSQIGRSYRGRTYLAGVPVDDVTDNLLESTPQAAFQDAFNGLFSYSADQDYDMVVLSRWHNKAKRDVAVLVPITSVQVRPYLATQRRRLPLQ